MPNASQVSVTVDGSSILTLEGTALDADGDGLPGGKMQFNFSTVSVVSIPGTVCSSRIVDPGPDLIPRTADDVTLGNGYTYLLPIRGVKIYVLGMESNFTFTDATGKFTLTNMPVGDVKVVLDGRTATNPPAGYYFPEMVMDTTFSPGITNGVMTIRDANGNVMRDGNGVPIQALAMYLPRVASNVLQTVSGTNNTVITAVSNAGYNLTSNQLQYLTITVPPNSLIGANGQPMSSGQVGVSVVPPELVADMLPPGLLQHTFDITVQAPGVATFTQPAQMTFPNVFGTNAPPGSKLNFLSFDHTTGRLVIEGTGTVSADGLYVTTDPGTGVTHPGWHGLAPPGTTAGGGGGGSGCGNSPPPGGGLGLGAALLCRNGLTRPAYCEAQWGSPCRAACSACLPDDPAGFEACIQNCASQQLACLAGQNCPPLIPSPTPGPASPPGLVAVSSASGPEDGEYAYAFENLYTGLIEVRGSFRGLELASPVFLGSSTFVMGSKLNQA